MRARPRSTSSNPYAGPAAGRPPGPPRRRPARRQREEGPRRRPEHRVSEARSLREPSYGLLAVSTYLRSHHMCMKVMTQTLAPAVLVAALLAAVPVQAQTTGGYSDLPEAFRIDAGGFRIAADTKL